MGEKEEKRRRRSLGLVALLASPTASLCMQSEKKISLGPVSSLPTAPWGKGQIDYSAANEYVQAHYSQTYGRDQSYFWATESSIESIYDARSGVHSLGDVSTHEEDGLENSGFVLVSTSTAVADWSNMDMIKNIYLPELRCTIPLAFGESGRRISHMVFYQPMIRGEDCVMSGLDHDRTVSPPTSPVAGLVHIDTDFGAHDLDGILDMVENNLVSDVVGFPRHNIADVICNGRNRFAIVNCWKNADPLGRPISRAPLGLLLPYYCCDKNRRNLRPCFPDSVPDGERSRWYVYPQMAADECLLFKQYDRRLDRSSDIWHCAIDCSPYSENGGEVETECQAPKRYSFDIRAFIVFDEVVSKDNDRYSPDRLRPVLSLEESGCFCDEQARKDR
uniref:Uncharacterized protein n=1 Tax=Odontella aurita TaxID=265563 RepID=A0A7S4JLH8_9STRA|mmetsp:Transcript_48612/g.146589  ORF Transcript_48612/g.146589 Transcript_48612/m.146589 type:complete len:390 (+) Transcript_48612:231-1400(+)